MTGVLGVAWLVGLALVAWPAESIGWRHVLGALWLGVVGARAFELAHEALHLHFTGRRWLDRLIGYVFLLPSLKPLAPTIYGHVQRHHRFTNVKGYDTQWSPTSTEEYAAFSGPRRWLERVYRSLPGLGLYWGLVVVLRYHTPRGMVLSESVRPRAALRSEFARDRLLVLAYVVAHLAFWPGLAGELGVSALWLWALGFFVPLLLTHWLLGAVTFLQHTCEDVPWFESPAQWSFFDGQVRGTVDVLPHSEWMASVFSDERPHGAHHIDMRVSMPGLRRAQRAVDEAFPGASPVRVLTFAYLMRTVARCKLYDFRTHRWVDFEGNPATESLLPAEAACRNAGAALTGGLRTQT